MKSNERLYLDIHVLQTLPPSCINRDDTGSPKTAVYGGVTRARVSSQSWKRAMRLQFQDSLSSDKIGVRTKRLVELVSKAIVDIAPDKQGEAQELAEKVLKTAGLSIDSAKGTTDALFFMSNAQAKTLAQLSFSDPWPTKSQAKKALEESPGVDVVLFGRMVASDPGLNIDACAQVAHSLSTHQVSNEYDYFTAVDDLTPEDTVGAGHIGTVEFNSSTLYRYATLAVHELRNGLAADASLAASAFVDAFVCTMPTGRQNTFANRTLPDAVLVCLRKDQPLNLVGAFERPVRASNAGFLTESTQRLVQHARQVYQDYANPPLTALVVGRGLEELGTKMSMKELLARVEGLIASPEDADGEPK